MPLFQNESKCETCHMKMSSACSLIFMQISNFHKNGFALGLEQRHKGTRKWPILFAFLSSINTMKVVNDIFAHDYCARK